MQSMVDGTRPARLAGKMCCFLGIPNHFLYFCFFGVSSQGLVFSHEPPT